MYAGREYDGSWREPYWQRLYEEAGADERAADIVEAFKELYTMYTDDLVEWYANLYDPHIGGYYCTTSGKENEGFTPDIESSVQAVNFVEGCGMIDHLGRDWTTAFPEEFKKGLLRFATRMQEPNGYFYHLLKTREEGDRYASRLGRDLGWCTGVMKRLGASPTYDTPNNMKGNGIDAWGNPVKIEKSRAAADKAEASAEEKTPPYADYLENDKTFIEYLNEKVKMVESPYSAGNLLNATCGQIGARDNVLQEQGAGYSLRKILVDWLNERINPETGLWGYPSEERPKGTEFLYTNGLFKVLPLYNGWGYPYPYPERAVESVLEGILGDEPSTANICEVYNLWSALIAVKANVIKCHPAETRDKILAVIDETMKNKGAAAIRNTYVKQSGYQMPDGAFAHNVNRCLKGHQGDIRVGLGLEEGDVDAIGKATNGIISNVCQAFGFTKVPIYSQREWEIYLNIIKNAKPVIKENTKPLR